MEPATAEEAVDILNSAVNPSLLAGGTDLCAQFNEGFAPGVLINLGGIQALRKIEVVDDALSIGAMVTHFEGARHQDVKRLLPGFSEAWARIATVRVRMSATIGGNLMARRTRYEGALLLTALGAGMRLLSANGPYEADAESLWHSDLAPRSLLLSIRIPVEQSSSFHYARALRPAMTQAVCVKHGVHGYTGRLVVATEFLPPVALPLDLTKARTCEDIAAQAKQIARETLRALPASFADACVSNEYAREVSEVILRRQLQAIASESAL
jgi:carbon-monoxide dehydrogenase medium subunit